MISNFSRFLALFYKFSLAISIIAGLGIFYKFASPYLSKYKEGKLPPLLEFIKNFIFYVPCLLINVIENIAGTKRSTWILLLIQIIAIAAYFGIPALLQSNYFKKGTILINKPQHLNNVASIDQETLDTIMENTKRSLHYALSADVWIDPQPTSTRLAYTKDTNLLSFGNRLHIEYNGTTPRNLIIKALDGEKTIVVAKPIIPLQKWNKIILNYDHGTLDIFLNKELIHSQQNVPYTTLASIQAGSIRGIYGGIKDVRFFYEPLTKNEINLL
jgi:hypothetical protein